MMQENEQNKIQDKMNCKILLIIPPFWQGGNDQESDLCGLKAQLEQAGFALEILDARLARLNLFQILREVRRCSTPYVMIAPVLGTELKAISNVLVGVLKTALPLLKVVEGLASVAVCKAESRARG